MMHGCAPSNQAMERTRGETVRHVRRQEHRQGAGTGLVSEVARWCRANYTDCGLYLWVIAQNHQARRFYERLGATDRGGELRAPSAGGGEPRDVRRYAWTAPIDIARVPK